MYECRVECDSVTLHGERLTTLVMTLPRIMLAELNTHRILSKSSASSRAIPVKTQIERLRSDPFYPVYWGKNEKGMQANQELSADEVARASAVWDRAREANIGFAEELAEIGVHKQITNRRLECDMWHTVVITGTDWDNFDHLRRDKDAQPEFRKAAEMIFDAMGSHTPTLLGPHEWHRPFMRDEDFGVQPGLARGYTQAELVMISVGRAARVSYLTHDGRRAPEEDILLARDRLLASGHMAPWEHVARPMSRGERHLFWGYRWRPICDDLEQALGSAMPDWTYGDAERTHYLGNLNGWVQARKLIVGEHDIKGHRQQP